MAKLDKWEDRLLDLGKRNKLINYKDSKVNTLEVVFPSVQSVYSIFTGEKPSLSVVDIDDMVKKNHLEKSLTRDIASNLTELKNNQIALLNRYTPTQKVLKTISKKAKETILERGINVLYLAIGFVWWREEGNNAYYKAPLILVPISIKNESATTPTIIEQYEDEVIINPTLCYKLAVEKNVKLPILEDGEDLEEYLLKVAKTVAVFGWKTTKEMRIGLFSFLKMNMYLDIKNNADFILQNKNVLTLLGERQVDEKENVLEADKAKNSEMVLHNVVDADSSQTEAIKMAKQGLSFVLQGPPGTGKSQTITNIIAECLYDGKKVLFVSEKLAALSVVYNNLKKAELDDFCLELHSYKTNKKEVIAELNRILNKPKSSISGKALEELTTLSTVKKRLDDYAEKLHETTPTIEVSPYRVFCEVAGLDGVREIEYIVKDVENKGMDHLTRSVALIEKYVEYTKTIGVNYKKNEWYGYVNTDTSYSQQITLKQHLISALGALTELRKVRKEIVAEVPLQILNVRGLELLKQLFSIISGMKFVSPKIFSKKDLDKFIAEITKCKELSAQILVLKKELDETFDENIYKLDGNALYARYVNLYSGVFRDLKRGYNKDKTDVKLCLRPNKKLNYKHTVVYLEKLKEMQGLEAKYQENEEFIKDILGDFYFKYDTDYDYAIKKANEIKNFYSQGMDLSPLSNFTENEFSELRYSMAIWATKLGKVLNLNLQHFEFLAECFDKSIFNLKKEYLEKVIEKLSRCSNNIGELENWVLFYKLLVEAKDLDVLSFIESAMEKNVKVETMPNLYALLFYKQWAYQIFSNNEVLSELDRVSHDKCVKLFKEKDELTFEISKAQINAKLSAMRPNVDAMAPGSQVAVLVREQEKQRKQMPVRVLLSRIPELILTLKPCFLMSPLSVSTFLDADIQFDVVIFDEASQIFPEDALGAIYRAKQVIVVGDSKQMPPSNFFTASIGEEDFSEEDYNEDVEDFESILDICTTAFSQNRLKWHYRSKTEDLIAFSNKNYYNGELVTFPSAIKKNKNFGVDFYYVQGGIFDRKTKTNLIEAEQVANMVIDDLRKFPERSLGVVAFSQSQQEAIERIIARKRDENKSLDKLFDNNQKEPFFVKNLETVQGDERDTIIFSVGYARDNTGKFFHNFGPLNRVGGERRLNVAVTRAKYNVKLVASIKYYDIDLNKTAAEGARLLREYLDYAENGAVALERSVRQRKLQSKDNAIINDIYDFLSSAGYIVEKGVGNSAYKIDLAVKHPTENRFVLAIECDGQTYILSKSTRDRDRLRESVLTKLGWQYYRVWSTDWFRNNKVEKKRLLSVVKEAISRGDGKKSETAEKSSYIRSNKSTAPIYKEYEQEPINETNYDGKYSNLICKIIIKEAPVSEEWIMKRTAVLFGKTFITKAVKDAFNESVGRIKGITRKGGFIYKTSQTSYELRVAKKGEQRDVKYIAPEELAAGIEVAVKQNIELTKEGLYKMIAKKLGYSRAGDVVTMQLDKALQLLKKAGKIVESGDLITLK